MPDIPTKKEKAISNKLFESKWLHNQVETHLIFGPIVRHIDLCWFVLLIPAIQTFNFFLYAEMSIFNLLILIIYLSFPLMLFWVMNKSTRFKQAAIGWVSVKGTLFIVTLCFMILGPITSIQRGQTDAIPLFLMGLIWFPCIEFIPKISPKQKYITFARLILTIPVYNWGMSTGFWHWGPP